ncbi:DUF5696 domain-containing protein [Ruminococcus sp. Marseille-P6503]|uniref:DUF5696 domain-containing protein n=1 Tax=Ruminococcus sp. Marseille-P6503 TaxID=2364796 RepID=UPI000F52CF22|nr:DUF5696 domain-containing protein [Ruminococcus sp. Marseille-P6503]
MHNKNYKKAIVFALVLTMLMPLGSMAASSAEDNADGSAITADTAQTDQETDAEDASDDEESDSEEDEDELPDPITDEEAAALETCQEVASNDSFVMYADEENERIGLYVKASGKYWWTSPINVMSDDTIIDETKGSTMKNAQRNSIASSVAIKVGDLRQEKRTESPAPVYSTRATKTWRTETNGVAVTYKYGSEGVKFTVHYELCEDNLYVYADTSEIEEENTSSLDGKVLTKLQLCPYFGAVSAKDETGEATEGYMIVPDGSGAVIEYNNGKVNYADYSQQIYGRDYTTVPLNAPRVTEQAYMPVIATVSGTSGLVAVVSDGDANVYAKAQVSGQNKQSYNNCYFEFETRSQDAFFMSGDSSNKITVFEKGGIKTERFGIRYYPIDNDEGVNYADCAEVYRNYLINNKGLAQRTEADSSDLYIDFFGGVLKQTSIVGIPFMLKTEITGFSQAQQIVDKFKENGVSDIVVNYNDWTNASIKNNISTKVKPSGTLGGTSDFNSFIASENVDVFPSMNNIQMDSGSWGYMTFTNTAIRVSNAYSRQSTYSPAFGVPESGVAPALLAPNSYVKVFEQMVESYQDKELDKIGFGDYSTKLVSDFSSKNSSSRNDTMNTIVNGYKSASESVGAILCDGANAYVLPYASQITNVPVYSSGFNLTDYDIPFYQMVIHGYVPYSTKPINASSNTGETFMLALAAGSGMHYDMVYEDAAELKDTEYDDLYYSNYEGWLDMAAKQSNLASQILSGVSDMTISNYEISDDGNVITTTYSKDGSNVVIEVDMSAGTASVDGQVYDLGDAIEGGIEG